MGCNCGDNEYNISIDNNGSCEPTTPIYNIALGNVGVDGFSPSINIINQTLSSFQLEITDINGRTVTDPIPISDYIEATFAKLASANTFTANNTFNGLTYFNGTMYTDKVYSKTPTNPLIIGGNSSTITLGANDTTANYHGYEIVNTNSLSTTLASYSTSAEIASTYLEKDGSNASSDITINNMPIKTYAGSGSRLGNGGSLSTLCIQSRDIRLQNYNVSNSLLASIQLSNGNVNIGGTAYYGGYEIATLNDIPDISDLVTTTELNNTLANYVKTSDLGDGTITITQGGVLKGTFTTNQSGDATIDLDAGGGSVTNPITLTETISGESSTDVNTLELGIDTTTGNPILNLTREVTGSGFYYTLNYNLLRYAQAKTNGGLKDNWADDSLGCRGNSLEVKVDNDTIKINGSGELYADVQGGSSYTAGTGIDITNDTISIDTSVVAQLSDIPDVSNLADIDLSNLSETGQNIVDTVKDQNTSTRLKYWTGTQAQYDAIVTKDNDTIYNVEDTSSPIINILDTLYPVGAIYIGTMATCPLVILGIGTWQLVAQDRVLQGAGTRGTVGTTINESLPNIKGNLGTNWQTALGGLSGAFYTNPNATSNANTASGSNSNGVLFDASRSSSTYQDNAPVQQNGYLVNIWERIS